MDFIFFVLLYCKDPDDAIAHEEQKVTALDCVSCVLFCSSHAMTSSVIYYSTDHNLVPRAMPVRGLGWHWLWGNGMRIAI